MAPLKKGNRNLALRLLLLTGCLFLFATQFNYRFYDLANFYVYGNHTSVTADHSENFDAPANRPGQQTLYRSRHQKGHHLSLDKRFRINDIVNASFTITPAAPSYRVIQRKFYTPVTVCCTSGLPINALRGPPCA
jgi:hypothetical protein